MARANRSVRLFDMSRHAGRRPPAGRRTSSTAVGYLMRTTAVYGSGKFGLADRERIADRPEFAAPFQAEMLTVLADPRLHRSIWWITRPARAGRTPRCGSRRRCGGGLGVGNATGLGMAPFLVNHPALLAPLDHGARDSARPRARAGAGGTRGVAAVLDRLRARARARRRMADGGCRCSSARIAACRDLDQLAAHLEAAELLFGALSRWERLYRWSETELGLEAQEFLVDAAARAARRAGRRSCRDHGGDEGPDFHDRRGHATRRARGADREASTAFALQTISATGGAGAVLVRLGREA